MGIRSKFILGIAGLLILTTLTLSVVFIKQSETLLIRDLEGKAALLDRNFSIVSAKGIGESTFSDLQQLIHEVGAKDPEIRLLVVAYPNGMVIATSDQEKFRQFSRIDDPYVLGHLNKKESRISRDKSRKLLRSVRLIYPPTEDEDGYETEDAHSGDEPDPNADNPDPTPSYQKEVIGFIYIELDTSHLEASVRELRMQSWIIALLITLLGIVCAYFFGSQMTGPIKKLAQNVRIIASGDMSNTELSQRGQKTDAGEDQQKAEGSPRQGDEIMALTRDFEDMVVYLQNMAYTADRVASGDLTHEIMPRSQKDTLGNAFQGMLSQLRKFQEETDGMIQAVGQGTLDIRGNSAAFEGGWRDLVSGVNHLIGGLSDAVSKSAALAQEMELARKIQTSLLPVLAEEVHPDMEIVATMLPADEVGGDFYDVTLDRSGNLWVAIGDVSGHGVTPGLIMMMTQTVHMTVTTNLECDARGVVCKINEILYKNVRQRLKESHFMTFMALKYLGNGRFQHAGAHLSMIVFRDQTRTCERIRTRGIYLNFKPDISRGTKNDEFSLNPGDTLVLYTDGLTEAHTPDDKMLDIDGFVKIVERHVHLEPEAMKEMIMADAIRWCDDRRADDMTWLL